MSASWQSDVSLLGIPDSLISLVQRAESEAEAVSVWSIIRPTLSALWKAKAAEFHPDHGGSAAKFIEARSAYERVISESWAIEVWRLGRTHVTKRQETLDGIFELRDPAFLRRMQS